VSAQTGPVHDRGENASTASAGVPKDELQAGWLGNQRRRATAEFLLLLLAVATVVVCLLEAHGAARLLLVLAAACLIPGGALLTCLPVEDALEAFGVAVGLGFTIEAIGALAMVWTGWWHPFGWGIALGTVACGVLAIDLRRNISVFRKSM
jgi:hypothetical protein